MQLEPMDAGTLVIIEHNLVPNYRTPILAHTSKR